MNYNIPNTMRAIITSNDFVAVGFNTTLLKGSGIPPSTLGYNGDYFLNRATGDLYFKINNVWTFDTNIKGPSGASSYTYIAYASDTNGGNFTMAFDPSLNFIAILNTISPIVNPQASNFAGLWKDYKGSESDDTMTATVSEDLAAGAFVNVYGINGTNFVKNANASNNNSPATGFVLAGYNLGDNAQVYLSGLNSMLNSLVPEKTYYLDTSDGYYYIDAPVATGNIIQPLGVAINSTTLDFSFQEYILIG